MHPISPSLSHRSASGMLAYEGESLNRGPTASVNTTTRQLAFWWRHIVAGGERRPDRAERNKAFTDLFNRLEGWSIPDAAVDRVHDAARTSLSEVKALTEYEDGKVSRLLTIIAFLSALVAAVFTRFVTDYAWPKFESFTWTADWLLPAATYTVFFLYVVLVTWSVLTVLRGVRPVFNIPETWTGPGRFLAISSRSKNIQLAGDEVDHRL